MGGDAPGSLGGVANPEITPATAVAALPGSFPGDLGIELVELTEERAVGRLAATFGCTQLLL